MQLLGAPPFPRSPPGEPAEEESVYPGALVPGALRQSYHREDRAAAAAFTPSGSLTECLVVQDKPELDGEYDCWEGST